MFSPLNKTLPIGHIAHNLSKGVHSIADNSRRFYQTSSGLINSSQQRASWVDQRSEGWNKPIWRVVQVVSLTKGVKKSLKCKFIRYQLRFPMFAHKAFFVLMLKRKPLRFFRQCEYHFLRRYYSTKTSNTGVFCSWKLKCFFSVDTGANMLIPRPRNAPKINYV